MDACSIINLDNAGALGMVSSLPCCDLFLSPIVVGECNATAAASIVLAHSAGQLSLIDDHDVPAGRFFDFLDQFELGDGETECIALAENSDFVICCDDRKARRAAAEVIGAERVIGSLRLLQWAATNQSITPEEASAIVSTMKECGAFLPDLPHDFFL